MSKQYNAYLDEHISNVKAGFLWMKEHVPDIVDNITIRDTDMALHDMTKYQYDEYLAYDAYFHSGERTEKIERDFNYAWLRHIHKNPHHWQHWVLVNDDPELGNVALEMPTRYIIEMICDWWSFSWKSGDLFEIFDWYEKHKDRIVFAPVTRAYVEMVLAAMKNKLEALNG
jgi:hypothetical protein